MIVADVTSDADMLANQARRVGDDHRTVRAEHYSGVGPWRTLPSSVKSTDQSQTRTE
jgi:hypothetical protein